MNDKATPDNVQLGNIWGFFLGLFKILTIWRVALALILALGSVLIFAMLESRASWSPALYQSPVAMTMAIIGLVTLAGWAVASSVYSKMSADLARAQGQLELHSSEQIASLKNEVTLYIGRLEHTSLELTKVQNQEIACRIKVTILEEQVKQLQNRNHRIDSGFGGIDGTHG